MTEKTTADYLDQVATRDVAGLKRSQLSYGDSWKKRGGVGAFMMLARKWDRLETALQPHPKDPHRANGSTSENPVAPWDVLSAAFADQRAEGIIDDISDLRRYLMLVEAELLRLGFKAGGNGR